MKEIAFAATTYSNCKKVWAPTVGEALVHVQKRAQISSDRYAVAVKNIGTIVKTFTSKAVAGVFAVFATGKYTVATVSVERKHVEWRGV